MAEKFTAQRQCRSPRPPFVVKETGGISPPHTPMRYLLLIYTNEAQDLAASPEVQGKVIGEYMELEKEMAKSKVKLAGEALQPISTATTVRVRNGKTQTIDGPFAETKEQLGGFYLIEAKNLDDAIKWAVKMPSARDGSIEVRPIMEFPAQ